MDGDRRVRGVGLLLALVLVVLPLGLTAGPATATEPPRAPAAAEAERPELVDLRADYRVPARTHRGSGEVWRWPGRTIRYHETIPAKWQWSLDRAIAHWNRAGGNIRFKKVASKSQAQVVIRYGYTQGSDGLATVGPARNGFVHLSPEYKRVDALDATNRVWVGRLFAHELGHTLGFWHTEGDCSLMVALFHMQACPLLADQHPGYFHQRWIDRPLLKRLIKTYGGSPRRPAKLALIAPLPPQILDVEFDGGLDDDRPVEITWQTPDAVPAGSQVQILRWLGDTCEAPPRGGGPEAEVDPDAGVWTDPDPGAGTWCYQARIANRYGATRPGFSTSLQRWAPTPDAPALGDIVWDPVEQLYRFTWDAPEGTALVVQSDVQDPESCQTTYDESLAVRMYPDLDGIYRVSPGAARECLTFFAVNEWHTGPPTARVVEVPPPTETPVVGEVGPEVGAYGPIVSASLADERYTLRVEVLAGPCPAEVPQALEWYDGWEFEPDRWQLPPEGAGVNCALFTAVDESFYFTLHGPVVMREFTA